MIGNEGCYYCFSDESIHCNSVLHLNLIGEVEQWLLKWTHQIFLNYSMEWVLTKIAEIRWNHFWPNYVLHFCCCRRWDIKLKLEVFKWNPNNIYFIQAGRIHDEFEWRWTGIRSALLFLCAASGQCPVCMHLKWSPRFQQNVESSQIECDVK